MKIRILLTFLSGLVWTTCTQAQKPTRTVSISGTANSSTASVTGVANLRKFEQSKTFEQQVILALQARLNATTHFSVANEIAAELNISLACFDVRDLIEGANGGICSYLLVYYPKDLAGLNTIITGPAIVTGGAPGIGEDIFQQFVKDATEENLKTKLELILSGIRLYEANKLVKAKP
jgi:hypothetical protein